MSFSLKQTQAALLAFACLLIPGTLRAQAPEATVAGADLYFLKTPGQKVSAQGKVYHRERLLRTSLLTSTVLAPETVQGRQTVVHEMLFTIRDARGKSLADGVRMKSYSLVDSASCSTFAIKPQGKPLQIKESLYQDLRAPVAKGESWSFEDFSSLTHPRVPKVHIEYTTTIAETDLTLEVAGKSLEGCIHLQEIGRVTERPDLTCIDGSQAKVRITIERSRWFCPGVGPVREDGKQLYVKDTPGAELCDLTSDHFEVLTLD